MRKKNREIVIPISKILPVAVIIFVVFQIFNKPEKPKEDILPQTKDTATVKVVFNSETQIKKNEKGQKLSNLTTDDIAKTLQFFPPNLSADRDTIIWQENEIIRYFSIDTSLQRRTEMLVRRAKTKYGAAVVMNPQSGQILALVSQFDEEEQQKIADNLCLSNIFPAASIIKTITAEAAFDNITDITCKTENDFVGKTTTLYKRQFFPENFSENTNKISFAEAFAKSNNPVFARLAVHSIGRENLAKSAMKFGWNSNVPFEMPCDISVFPETNSENINDTIHLAELGSGFNDETTLTPLLGALVASTVVNKGSMMTPTIVDSVSDISGKKLFAATPKKWKNCTAADIADSLKFLMQETTRIGSARKPFDNMKIFAKNKDIIFGGKTGTKDSKLGRNEWFVGFAQDRENDFSLATSICFVQYPRFVLRPSQVSADIMLDKLRKNRIQIKEKEI